MLGRLLSNMPIGRNDPCPCRSGKKYKRCHGALAIATDPKRTRAEELTAVDSDLTSRLLRFARTRIGPAWLDAALADYAGSEEADLPERELALALPWALHFRRPEGVPTVAEVWAAEQRRRVTDDQRSLLDAYANAWLSIWKVERVERGVGTLLVDRLTHTERFAYDVTSSGTLDLHDSLLAIIVECDGVAFFGGAHPQPLPPRHAERVLRDARKLCRVRTRPVDPDLLRNDDIQLELIDFWNAAVDALLAAPPPTLTNTDGDRFAFTTDDFELTSTCADVVARLASIVGAQQPEDESEDTVIVFTKPGNAMHRGWSNTVVGRAVVNDRSLRVETTSLRRADALKAIIESQLSGMVRYRLRQETNTAELMTRAIAEPSPSPAAREGQPPEIAAAIRQFRKTYMRAWLDEAVPALGGLTPRVAAGTPRARRALEVLLEDIERSESRLPPGERIDLGWLRPELGLER
jgi:hypothetical protein